MKRWYYYTSIINILLGQHASYSRRNVSAYGGYEYCSDGAGEKFLQTREECNGLNCNKEHLVRYWGKTF